MYFNKWGVFDGCFWILMLIKIRKVLVYWLMNMGVFDFKFCCILMIFGVMYNVRGFLFWCDNNIFKLKNLFD